MANAHESRAGVVSEEVGIERNASVDKSGRDSKEGEGSREGDGLNLAEVDAAIPRGTIDPVYERKARVLNAAVSTELSILSVWVCESLGLLTFTD